MQLPRTLRGFLATSALFTLLCLGSEVVCHFYLHLGTPYSFPVLRVFYTGDHKLILFPDFHQFFIIFPAFHSRAFFTGVNRLSYPAPAVVVYKLFLTPQPQRFHATGTMVRYGLALLACSWFLLFRWWRALVARGLAPWSAGLLVAGTYLFSFPVWFEYMQGNIEWVVWIILSVAIWAFCQKRYTTAALLIGLAASMKFYPILYIGLLIPVRRYREMALSAVTVVISTLVSLWLVCPDVSYSWRQTLHGLGNFKQESVLSIDAPVVGFDHSLFAPLKLVLTSISTAHAPDKLLLWYIAVLGLIGLLLFFARIRHLPVPNQVLCLSIAAILLPPLSYDYTLLHLYAGLVLLSFVAIWQEKKSQTVGPAQTTTSGLWAALLLLAFLLSPESELIWHGNRYAGQVKALALLALGYVSLRYPFALPGLPGFDGLSDQAAPSSARTRAIVSR